jgi:predicted secreted hydrolase
MNKRLGRGLFILIVLFGLGWVLILLRPTPAQNPRVLEGLVSSPGDFTRVTGPVQLEFPRDMGPHPDTQTEWWYYTGNLKSEEGKEFGYELTFFRRALLAPDQIPQRQSTWAVSQVYLAHFALTDVAGRAFHQSERIERGAAGLAGAKGTPAFQVWLQDWSVTQTGSSTYELSASQDGVSFDLILSDQKGFVLQGDQGYSQKGPEPGNASIYVSLPRLETKGRINLNGVSSDVNGYSWMDHEYGTSALGKGEVGWDWFSIQLDNENELMVYNIRNKDGGLSPFSRGLLILKDGSTKPLKPDQFAIQVSAHWKSPHTGAEYPSAWTLRVPSENLVLRLSPKFADQELRNSFVYWEGAVRVDGTSNGSPISGSGYVELTGYARSFEDGF